MIRTKKVSVKEFCSIYREIKELKFVSEEEAKDYWQKWQEGNPKERQQIKQRLQEAYLFCVEKVSRSFQRHFHRYAKLWNMDADDFFQAGYFGLPRAMKKYDPARGVKFESFLKEAVGWEILREIANYDPTYKKIGREQIPLKKVAVSSGLKDETVEQILRYLSASNAQSLDKPIFDDEKRPLHEVIGGEPLEKDLRKKELRRRLLLVVRNLEFPLRLVLVAYFWRERTWQEITERLQKQKIKTNSKRHLSERAMYLGKPYKGRAGVHALAKRIYQELKKDKVLQQLWEDTD